MVVTGAVATASGPHPGDSRQVDRIGLGIRDTVYVHVRATAVFGIGLLIIGALLWRLRRELPGVVRLAGLLLGVLLRPDGGRRDPVSKPPAVGARARPRDPRRADLGAHGRGLVLHLASAASAHLIAHLADGRSGRVRFLDE